MSPPRIAFFLIETNQVVNCCPQDQPGNPLFSRRGWGPALGLQNEWPGLGFSLTAKLPRGPPVIPGIVAAASRYLG